MMASEISCAAESGDEAWVRAFWRDSVGDVVVLVEGFGMVERRRKWEKRGSKKAGLLAGEEGL